MDYRDDREALRSEVENLRKELADSRAEQERLGGIKQRLNAAKREMDSLQREFGARKKKGPGSARILVALGGLTALLVGGAVAFVVMRRPRPSPAVQIAPPEPPPAPPKEVAAPEPPPLETAPPPPTPSREAHTVWSATVVKATGLPLAPGARCSIEADVRRGKSSSLRVDRVQVKCGAHALYDEEGRLNGMSMLSTEAQQAAGPKASTFTYAIMFSDEGSRSSTRNQAKLDSTQKVGRVWSDNLPDFRVDLSIMPQSAPVDIGVLD